MNIKRSIFPHLCLLFLLMLSVSTTIRAQTTTLPIDLLLLDKTALPVVCTQADIVGVWDITGEAGPQTIYNFEIEFYADNTASSSNTIQDCSDPANTYFYDNEWTLTDGDQFSFEEYYSDCYAYETFDFDIRGTLSGECDFMKGKYSGSFDGPGGYYYTQPHFYATKR